MPKYFREVSKQFSGDNATAEKYIGIARGLLGGLVEMSGDVFQNIRRVILPDGTKIEVEFVGETARIAIDVRRTKPVIECAGAGLVRGLLIGGFWHYSNWEPEDGPSAWVPVSNEPIDVGGELVYPSVFWFQYTDDAGGDWLPERRLLPLITYRVPSMYSGHMRKVVQLLHARKKDIPYRYDWEATHGCILLGKTLWLIEISYVNGVLARKLPVEPLCIGNDGKVILPDGLPEEVFDSPEWIFSNTIPSSDGGAFSTGTALLDDIASGKVIRLAEAEVLNAAYGHGKQSMFTECGWAFNTEGGEASSVVHNHTPDGYPITYLYTVTIHSEVNIQTGDHVLTRATMEEVMSGVVCNGMNTNSGDMSRIVFKTPSDGSSQLKSFDPRRIHDTEGMTSHWGEEGPLYVFYRKGERVLVMGKSVGEVIENYVDITPGFDTAANICFGEEFDGHSLTIENEQPSHGVYVPGHMTLQATSHDESGQRTHWEADGDGEATDLFLRRITMANAYYTYQQIITPTQVRPASAVVVPSYDREAIYCYEQTVIIETLSYERITGPYWFFTGDGAFTWTETPIDGDNSIIITGHTEYWNMPQCAAGPGIPSESGTGYWEYSQNHGLVGPLVSVGDILPRESWQDEWYTFTQEQSYDKNNDRAESTLFFLGSNARVELTSREPAGEFNPWIRPIAENNAQLITATQSAFIEGNYVISSDINAVFGADCLTTTGHNIDAQHVWQYFNRAFIGAC